MSGQPKGGAGALVPVIIVAVLALGAVGVVIGLSASHSGASRTTTTTTRGGNARTRSTTITSTTVVPGVTAASAGAADLVLGDLPGGWIEQVLPPPPKIEPSADGNGCSPVFGRSVVYDVRSADFGNGGIATATEGADSEVTVMRTNADAMGALQALEGPGFAQTCIQRSLDLGLEASLAAGTGATGSTGDTGGAGSTGGTGVTGEPTGSTGETPPPSVAACEPNVTSDIVPVPLANLGVPATEYDYRAQITCSRYGSSPVLEVDWVAFVSGHAFVDAQFFNYSGAVPASEVLRAVTLMAQRAHAQGV